MTKCNICGREPLKANWKSHSNHKTIRRQKINLQNKKVDGKKMTICTSCLKTLAKPTPKKRVKQKTK